jgi:hypothetical protein
VLIGHDVGDFGDDFGGWRRIGVRLVDGLAVQAWNA